MDISEEMTSNEDQLCAINICRIYLQCIFLSDITNTSRTHIYETAFNGTKMCLNKLTWPQISRPVRHEWRQWQQFINIFCKSRSKRHTIPIGKWYIGNVHIDAKFYKDPREDNVYERRDKTWTILKRKGMNANKYGVTIETRKSIPYDCIPIKDTIMRNNTIFITNSEHTSREKHQKAFKDKCILIDAEFDTIFQNPPENILCSSYGSFKQGVGAYSICIATLSKILLYIGSGKFYSHHLACSEYESEVYGELALTYQFKKIEEEHKKRVKYTIYIDNQSVVN